MLERRLAARERGLELGGIRGTRPAAAHTFAIDQPPGSDGRLRACDGAQTLLRDDGVLMLADRLLQSLQSVDVAVDCFAAVERRQLRRVASVLHTFAQVMELVVGRDLGQPPRVAL